MMKQSEKHHLTKHARLCLAELSIMTTEEFLDLAAASAVLVYRADARSQYEMIWSEKDRNGYVLAVNPSDGSVITIKRVLTRSGAPCLVHDARKAPNAGHEGSAGVARITSSMLEHAVLASGADLSDAQEILDALKKHELVALKPRTWHYRWVLRFLRDRDGKVSAKTATVGRASEVVGSPPSDIIEDAARQVAEAAGWDATLTLAARDGVDTYGEWSLAEMAGGSDAASVPA